MPKAKQPTDYIALTGELDELMAKLETGDLTIEEAVKSYERGMHIVGQLEEQLTKAENAVSELRTARDRILAE